MSTDQPVAKGEARERILDTAEELFAHQGVDAVSLRQINAAAGVSPGVLHYHFGSREVLVHELINRHMATLMGQREQRLLVLDEQAQPRLQDIIAALVMPLAELALAEGESGPRYVRFISRMYSDRSPVLEEISERYRDINGLYPKLLRRALPQMAPAELDLRFAMANHAMLQLLSELKGPPRSWLGQALEQVDKPQLIAILIDFMCSGVSGSDTKQSEEPST
ncbi:MAG: TetR/AcrR family transcriptional regulator [Halieaceae bacterium]